MKTKEYNLAEMSLEELAALVKSQKPGSSLSTKVTFEFVKRVRAHYIIKQPSVANIAEPEQSSLGNITSTIEKSSNEAKATSFNQLNTLLNQIIDETYNAHRYQVHAYNQYITLLGLLVGRIDVLSSSSEPSPEYLKGFLNQIIEKANPSDIVIESSYGQLKNISKLALADAYSSGVITEASYGHFKTLLEILVIDISVTHKYEFEKLASFLPEKRFKGIPRLLRKVIGEASYQTLISQKSDESLKNLAEIDDI